LAKINRLFLIGCIFPHQQPLTIAKGVIFTLRDAYKEIILIGLGPEIPSQPALKTTFLLPNPKTCLGVVEGAEGVEAGGFGLFGLAHH